MSSRSAEVGEMASRPPVPGVFRAGGAEPDPEYVAAVARRAAAHASRNEYPQALACYGQALLLDDSRAVLWFNYANVQRRMGMEIDAADSFEFALRLDPRLYAARYSLANLLFEMGQPLAAMEHYREVTVQNPDYVPAWRNLGKLQYAIGNVESALECLGQALRRAPHDAELAGLLADVRRKRDPAAEN